MQAEKPYSKLAEMLHQMEAHPNQPVLNKNAAWKQLQAKRQTRSLAWIWTAAALFLLALVVGWLYQRPKPSNSQPEFAKAPASAFPENPDAKIASRADSTAKVVQKKQKKAVVKEAAPLRVLGPIPSVAREEVVIDTISQIAVAQPPALLTPKPASKKIFHLNELRDPDRPYTVQDKKLRITTPVAARTERPFVIKLNLSN